MDPEDGATTGIMTGFEEENTFKNADVADVGTQYAQDHDEGAGFELQDELSNEIPQPGSSLTDHRLLWAQWVVENTDAVFQNSNNTRSSTHENDTNASLIGYQHYWQSASPARVRETSELSFSTQPDSAAFAHRGAFPRSSLPRNDAAPFQEDNRWLNTPTELQPGFVHEHPSSFVPLNAATPGTRLTLPCITVSPSPMSLHYPAVNMLSGMPYYSARTPQQSAGGLVMQPSYDQFLDNSAGAYTATSQSALSDEAYTYLSEVCGSQAELQSNTNLTSHATSSPWTPSVRSVSMAGPSQGGPLPLARSASSRTAHSQVTTEGSLASTSRRRGRGRTGPLTPDANRRAQRIRIGKDVCCLCKLHKVTCQRARENENPHCGRCQKKGRICVKHYFWHAISANNRTKDHHSGQYRMNCATVTPLLLSETVSFRSDSQLIESYMHRFNIVIGSTNESASVILNLSACHRHWQNWRSLIRDDSCAMDVFITNKHTHDDAIYNDLLKMPQCDLEKPIEAFLQLDSMSNQLAFSLVPKHGNWQWPTTGGWLDLQNNRLYLIALAVFQRTLHHLELRAYRQLELDLTRKKDAHGEIIAINQDSETVNSFGRVLLSLRRRLRIWKQAPPEHRCPDQEEYMEDFCYQLFCQFCQRQKHMERSGVDIMQHIFYPSIEQRHEYIPTDEGRNEFATWMWDRGNGL